MARRTAAVTIFGALAGAVLGVMALAVGAGVLADSASSLLLDPENARSRPEFLVTNGALNLFVVAATLAGGILISAVTVGLSGDDTGRPHRISLLIVGAGTGAAVALGFAAFRAAFGIGGGDPFDPNVAAGVVSLSVFRAVVTTLVSGAAAGAAAATTAYLLAQPDLLGLGGEAWPDRARFLRESAAATVIPTLGLVAAAGFIFGLSRILLEGSGAAAVIAASVAAAAVLGGAAYVAAHPPPFPPRALVVVIGILAAAAVVVAISFAVSGDDEGHEAAAGAVALTAPLIATPNGPRE